MVARLRASPSARREEQPPLCTYGPRDDQPPALFTAVVRSSCAVPRLDLCGGPGQRCAALPAAAPAVDAVRLAGCLWVHPGLSLSLSLATNKLAAGAADTPPLGWCSWQRYRCAISCNDSTSTDCFNERLIKDTADAMAASGLAKAGYEYVACALALQRAAS